MAGLMPTDRGDQSLKPKSKALPDGWKRVVSTMHHAGNTFHAPIDTEPLDTVRSQEMLGDDH